MINLKSIVILFLLLFVTTNAYSWCNPRQGGIGYSPYQECLEEQRRQEVIVDEYRQKQRELEYKDTSYVSTRTEKERTWIKWMHVLMFSVVGIIGICLCLLSGKD